MKFCTMSTNCNVRNEAQWCKGLLSGLGVHVDCIPRGSGGVSVLLFNLMELRSG